MGLYELRFEVMNVHRKISLIAAFLALLLITGCGPVFDGGRYVSSLLDALYKANYTDYAELTGTTTAELSTMRESWMTGQTDLFLKAFGAEAASDSSRARVTQFLNNVYAGASFTVRVSDAGNINAASEDSDAGSVYVTFRPICLISESYPALQDSLAAFNKKNSTYGYADMDSTAYTDAYLDGLMTVLEQHLTDLPLGDEVSFRVPISKTADGLYQADASAIARLSRAFLPLEAPELPETETETAAPETEAPETKAPETKAPETKAPETKAPETKAKETEAPAETEKKK